MAVSLGAANRDPERHHDPDVVVQEGATVGVDKEHDRARGLVVSSGGITVVGKGQVVPP